MNTSDKTYDVKWEDTSIKEVSTKKLESDLRVVKNAAAANGNAAAANGNAATASTTDQKGQSANQQPWKPQHNERDKVEAQADDGKWYIAVIEKVNTPDKTYEVKWEDTKRQDSKKRTEAQVRRHQAAAGSSGAAEASSTTVHKTEQANVQRWEHKYKEHWRLEAQADDGKWYIAIIEKVNMADKTYDVKWEDTKRQDSKKRTEDQIRHPVSVPVQPTLQPTHVQPTHVQPAAVPPVASSTTVQKPEPANLPPWTPKYKEQEKVESQTDDHQWNLASISAINNADRTYSLKWDDPHRKEIAKRQESAIRTPWKPAHSAGALVEAHANDGQWYPAHIVALNRSDMSYTVAWVDKIPRSDTVKQDSQVCVPAKYKPSERVDVEVSDGKWYPATIVAVNKADRTYTVVWDDEKREDSTVSRKEETIRVRKIPEWKVATNAPAKSLPPGAIPAVENAPAAHVPAGTVIANVADTHLSEESRKSILKQGGCKVALELNLNATEASRFVGP